jgi:hypothetical protein
MMSTLDDLKKNWNETKAETSVPSTYDKASLEKIIKTRTLKNMKTSMHYFWGALTLQILVYALLSHVIIKNYNNVETVLLGVGGILLHVPFTWILMKKFRAMAVTKPEGNSSHSLYDYVLRQHSTLQSFYAFKKGYEIVLIPLSTAIGTFLIFKLFVPGGVANHMTGAAITFLLSLLSCVWSIRSENKKSFERPLDELRQTLEEFERS